MHVYGHELNGWNGVDVRLDGKLQHSRVLNVVGGGLIIDFQCPAKRSQFVEYGRIFQWKGERWLPGAGRPVSVLLRRQPGGAWMWHAGTVLSLGEGEDSYNQATFVEVKLPQGTLRELVPGEQVRQPPREELSKVQRVEKDDFVIRCCPLSATQWSIGETFHCILSVWSRALCTSVLCQTLLYLQLREDDPLAAEEFQLAYDEAKKEKDTGGSTMTLWFNNSDRPTMSIIFPWVGQHWATITLNRKPMPRGRHRSGLPLPAELLVEIFQSLDSVERIRCRRVCYRWNEHLTMEAYFPDVRMTVGERYCDGDLQFSIDGLFWMVSGWLKCTNTHTKMVVITELEFGWSRHLAALSAHLSHSRHVPLLVFYGCDFTLPSCRINYNIFSVAALASEFATYDRILFKHCRISDDDLDASLPQLCFRGQSRRDMEMQLWDVVEDNLVFKKQRDRQTTLDWLADCKARQTRPMVHGKLC
ncbi:uncharacterized protein LOC129581578 [Paramacrobiotus metropolitanus]|uniref:uncharacterized protein LOC129581578 n=1 Tax=Paramacrobiotus metropolitanus TaxID=2943436 RepID=UPI0024463E02|nr:uncharacterized protein LOC129581578 [Paramacrobiotus metropolitanus]